MDQRRVRHRSSGSEQRLWALVWAGWVAVGRLQQWLSNAADNPFSGHPDSSGHFVTGLLGWNYLAAGLPGDPIEFAKLFYIHYPNVALGQWPPGYAAANTIWNILFSPSPEALLWMQALALGAAATLSCHLLRPWIGWLGALAATGLFMASSTSQVILSSLMAEPLVVGLCLLAVVLYLRYLERPGLAKASVFGVVAGLALLTKGVAISLAFLPAAALLCGRASLVKERHFWAPAGVVAALAGSWYLGLSRLPGWGREFRFSAEQVLQNEAFGWRYPYGLEAKAGAVVVLLGWGLAGLFVLGLVVGFVAPAIRQRLDSRTAVLGVYAAAALLCHFALRQSIEARHLLQALPVALGFAFFGARTLTVVALGNRSRYAGVAAAALLALCSAGGLRRFEPPEHGMAHAVEAIRADAELDDAVILVSSQSGGEVVFVAEVARREPRPQRIVLRGSKVLAQSGWNSEFYALAFDSADQIADYLDSIPVGVVVLDGRPGRAKIAHHPMLAEALERAPGQWRQISTGSDLVRVYRAPPGALRQRSPVRIDLTSRIGKILEFEPGARRPWAR